jgi:choline dehydrogenase
MDDVFDFIVIGSGSAGGALAARLSEHGKFTVAVLEAGTVGDHYFWSTVPGGMAGMIENPKTNWCRYSEPNPTLYDRRIYVPSGKMLGGSSAMNGMIYNRGHRQDYDVWAQMGCRGWSYDDVLPYFKKVESTDIGDDHYRGRHGPIRVSQAEKYSPFFDLFIKSAKAAGIPENPDYSGARQYGIAMAQNTIHKGIRQSSASRYLRPAAKREQLSIILGAEVTSLILEGRKCVGVRFIRGGVARELRVRREVILSAGAIASPKILELSGIGNPEILSRHGIAIRHVLNGVGENLRDHYGGTLQWKFNTAGLSWAPRGRGWRLGLEILRYLTFRKGFISQGWATMRVFGRSHEGVEDTDFALLANPYMVEYDDKKRSMSKVNGFFMYAQIQRPETAGSIHIKSNDPLADPAISYRFMETERDCFIAVQAVRTARAIMAQQPIAGMIESELLPGKNVQRDDEIVDYFRRTGATTFHLVGTCKMGPDPMAVVDDRLRVHGIAGLRVADTSIMPTIISGNTSVPAMMIGEKCADMIFSDLAA